ncbi:aldehyde dehydrogenase family protein [Gottfriedia acidiceleris]|uniref:aldehyde dehydrogenase family protein n=1 Tax=Gottfriedia acidiceleris TaxID=371036 RepID=UPI00101D1C14|nr:aldehyde dehydrogenase family protein [Gottfriedia acidiceleris]
MENKFTKQYINGVWREGSSTSYYNNTNPYNDEVIVRFKLGNKDDIEEAYEAAKKAQLEWAKTSPETRKQVLLNVAQIIQERKNEIITLLIQETGCSYTKAMAEVLGSVPFLSSILSCADQVNVPIDLPVNPGGKVNRVIHQPAGVVGIICPFNFPIIIALRAIAPAIAVGNAVVLKADLQTQITGGTLIAEVFEQAGLPKGVLNMVNFDVAEVGDYFVEHPIPNIISFTGSTNVGRHIGSLCTKNMKRACLELGGNNPVIILEDADLECAVNAMVFGKFYHQGQICVIANRILVHRKLYSTFIEKYVERVKAVKYGDPTDPTVFLGPLVNERQIQKVLQLAETAKREGATCLLEGKRIGNIVTPYIFGDVKNDSTLAQTEVFGPIASIIPFDTEEEALTYANHTEYGLSSAVFTKDEERGLRFAEKIESGMCHINDISANMDPTMPFGGVKLSGMGRYGGRYNLEEFTNVKWISIQKGQRKYPI